MADEPLVSVVLPCFNAAGFVDAAVGSLREQTHANLEIIVVDDGSVDATAAILRRHAAADARVRVLTLAAHRGLIAALNRGVAEARGDFIARLDADDAAVPFRIERQVAFLTARPDVAVVGSGAHFIAMSDGRPLQGYPPRCFEPAGARFMALFATPVSHPTILARAPVLKHHAYGAGPHSLYTEDYELFTRLLTAGAGFANVPDQLIIKRENPGGVSLRHEHVQRENFVRTAREHLTAATGVRCPVGVHRVFVNRMDTTTSASDLRGGLRLLAELEAWALDDSEPADRAEIRAIADAHRIDILVQAARRGALHTKGASGRLAAQHARSLLSRTGRSHLRSKVVRYREQRRTEPRLSVSDRHDTSSPSARVVYLHGRPGPHPLHRQFAEALSADLCPIDFRMRWQDRSRSRPYIATSWLVCAATFPHRDAYDVFLVDGLHIGPVLMRRLFLRSDQNVVADLASHTLYFLLTNRFSHRVEDLHLWALRRYDALICEGRMAVDIVTQLLGEQHPPIYETRGGVDDSRVPALAAVEPDLAGHRMVFIGGGPGQFRMHYKGLDLMVDAFATAATTDPSLHFDIVGEWDAAVVAELLARVREPERARLHFLGAVNDVAALSRVLSRAALYVHCSRGDAFPAASIEAMMAGVVPLVSEWTGTKQLVERVDVRLVAPLDAVELANRITWYFAQTLAQRTRLSRHSRDVAAPYTATAAATNYAAVFQRVCHDLGAPRSAPIGP